MTVSAVIPTWQEASTIAGAIASARSAGADEVIVSDGGSPDGTATVAARQGARVVSEAQGRGPQLNAGAAQAGGDVLWFLHADARALPNATDQIRAALADPSIVGGNFRIVFDDSPNGRFLAAFYHVIRQLRIFYGDSAIFCRRELFEELGGFPPYPIMEDLKFVHRLYRHGRLAYCDGPIVASPRRWEQGGVGQAWASWLVIQALYFARVSPERLGALYRQIR